MFRRLKSVLRRLAQRHGFGPSRWEQAFRARHGLGRNTGETLADVDSQLAMTRERIRGIEKLAERRRKDREF